MRKKGGKPGDTPRELWSQRGANEDRSVACGLSEIFEWLGVARQRFLENVTAVVDDIMGATVQFAQGGLYSTHSRRN